MFGRRTRDCDTHEWETAIHSGLRRDLCVKCGKIRMESVGVVTTKLPSFAETSVGRARTVVPGPEVADP